jgi:DNA-binding response OmpR family regulator
MGHPGLCRNRGAALVELKKILIVDDDVDIVGVVSSMLAGQGWQVLSAFSGEEALRIIEKAHPDLVLLDIMMPRMNGIEVLREARRLSPGMRVIMTTAFGDVGSYLESMDLGACEYINKPFETEELLGMIRTVAAR